MSPIKKHNKWAQKEKIQYHDTNIITIDMIWYITSHQSPQATHSLEAAVGGKTSPAWNFSSAWRVWLME